MGPANGEFRIIQSLELWFAMRFLDQITGSFAELVGGLGVKRLELLCACLLFIHHSLLRSYYMLHCHPFARVLDVFTTLYRLQGSFSQELAHNLCIIGSSLNSIQMPQRQ